MKFIAQRKLDELGRLVLPLEARIGAGVAEGGTLDLYLDEQGGTLWLQKASPSCINCCSREELRKLPGGKYICRRCLERAE